jgi:hypothetical protein
VGHEHAATKIRLDSGTLIPQFSIPITYFFPHLRFRVIFTEDNVRDTLINLDGSIHRKSNDGIFIRPTWPSAGELVRGIRNLHIIEQDRQHRNNLELANVKMAPNWINNLKRTHHFVNSSKVSIKS